MSMKFSYWLLFNILILIKTVLSSHHEEQLFKELFQNYNPLIRPVQKVEETITVSFSIALLQIISVVEKEQVLKTNVWLQVGWNDYQLKWKPEKYGGIQTIRVPPNQVWTPDIVLFNNADGKYEASFKSNVVVYYNGYMNWVPPAIYKSSCYIDVEFFPFDKQKCELRFGSWTYDQQQMNFTYYDATERRVTIKDYAMSGSWDLLDGPMSINQSSYIPSLNHTNDTSQSGASAISNKEFEKIDSNSRVEFICTLIIKRKTLFYTVNLIIPTVLISFLSVFVFYLPTDAGEKMTLSISILLALVVFLLLISKILPPTSIVIPLIAKYLLFTLIMNIVTILCTVVIINYNYRTPRTHKMPYWIRRLCIDILPRILRMERPKKYEKDDGMHLSEADRAKQSMLNYIQASRALSIAVPAMMMNSNNSRNSTNHHDQPLELKARHTSKKKHQHHHHHRHSSKRQQQILNQSSTSDDEENHLTTQEVDLLLTKEAYEAAEDLSFIANHMRSACYYEEIRDDWKYIASVIDRLQLFIFFAVTAIGTFKIFYNAPELLKVVDQYAILKSWDPTFATTS